MYPGLECPYKANNLYIEVIFVTTLIENILYSLMTDAGKIEDKISITHVTKSSGKIHD